MTRKCVIGLLCACLMLSACASKPPQTFTRIERDKVLPPTVLMQDTPPPIERFDSNWSLVETILEYRKALLRANGDKKALREWAEGEAK